MIGMLLYAAIAGSGIASDDGARVARPVAIKAACEASLALIRFQVARPGNSVVYSDWQGAAERDFDPGDYHWSPMPYARKHRVPVPSGPRIRRSHRLDNLGFSAVRHCSSVRRFLDRHRVAYGVDAVERAFRRRDPKAVFISVSLAAIDASGRQAVVTFGSTGLFGGGGWATALVRDATGRWRPSYSTPTWIT